MIEFDHSFSPEELVQQMDYAFEEQVDFLHPFFKLGFHEAFRRRSFPQAVFLDGKRQGTCSDSRVIAPTWRGEEHGPVAGVPSAGSLILLQDEDPQQVREFIQKSGIRKIYSHTGCGAGELLFRKQFNRSPENLNELDRFVNDTTFALAQEHNIECGTLIKLKNRIPCNIHPVRVVAFVGIPAYTPQRTSNFPDSFRVSRIFHLPTSAAKEVQLFTSIILGPKGFGPRITPNDPVVWLAVGDADNHEMEKDALVKELVDIRSRFTSAQQELIHIDGFNWSESRQRIV